MTNLRRRSARWALVALSAAALVLYFVLDGMAAEVVWNAAVLAQLGVAGACVATFDRHRLAWTSIIAGQVCFLAGDIGFTVLEFGLERELFPSFADFFYLAGYPLVVFGLLPIARTHRTRRDVGAVIDAGIVTLASTALLWVFVMDPTVSDSETSSLARGVAVAYTGGDVAALAVLALLLTRRRGDRGPLVLTAASVGSLLVADTVFALLELRADGYSLGAPVDALWWASYTLVALAAMHPGCEHLGDSVTDGPPRLTRRRLGALAVAASAAPVVVVLGIGRLAPSQVVVLLTGTVVLFVLVIVRLQLIAGDLEDSRSQLSHEATHDSLTGLANRALFGRELADAIGAAGGRVAVLCLDLDDFKPVNDQLGHPSGDRLLQVVARRLAATVRGDDLVARLGGDEFAILLRTADAMGAASTAERLIEAVRQPADVGAAKQVFPSVSVGVALGGEGATADDLLRHADNALYRSKRSGKGRWSLHDGEIGEQLGDWLGLHSDLHGALDADQLVIEYQPVVRLPDRAVVGAEALVRWRHPERGLIGPDEFIPVAEDSGLIVPIGAWVLEHACRAAQRWDPRPDGVHVSVNVSPVQVTDPGLVGHVRRALEASGLEGSRLVLEITETSDLSDERLACEVLAAVRDLGARIAIDDLGAGYASLRYLRALSIDVVKLDRSFLGRVRNDRGLLRGLIGLATSMDLTTVVEGVETDEHERIAIDCGATCAQGFLYARPMSARSLAAVVARPALQDR
ncbi:putative bifunctional diguanylate cyclase/phosphodiesterase [Ilumatobacter sp.]|uniref:putative bifunctional diguanylate cyclase/phosphodiesterase n=1 Tax=Ilumatobacter sp. TaxID=1967498 RepID=UPI003B51BDBF